MRRPNRFLFPQPDNFSVLAARILAGLVLVASGARGLEARTAVLGGVAYVHVTCEARELELAWKGREGVILRTFAAVRADLLARRREPLFLMNGGIFEPGGVPSGLLVIAGKEECPLNLKEGKGNFYLKPNGVFFVSGAGAAIMESERFAGNGAQIRLAVQSGPLLLERGKVHPAFRRTSASRLHRNGVGVDKDGRIHFLITDRSEQAVVNLHGFAEAFRSLGCPDALFLDGDLSQCFLGNEAETAPPSNRFGSIFVISRPLGRNKGKAPGGKPPPWSE